MAKYKKFEEWMVGKTVRDGDGDRGVVTRKHDNSDSCAWVEWEGIGEAWTYIDYLLFLDEVISEEVMVLQSRIEALEKDAARYRWLREQHWSESDLCVVKNPKRAVKLGSLCPSMDLLDVAIDNAMQSKKEKNNS